MAPSFSGSSNKRPLDMVVYDAAAAANKRARLEEEAVSSTSSSAAASSSASATAALFLRAASAPPPFGDFEPISAVPISVVPPQLPPLLLALPPVAGREEPPCLRKHFLKGLGLRADLDVHFIDDKNLTGTDLDPHQNRFRLPMDGAVHRLRPLLTPAELHAANLLFLPDPNPKPRTLKNKKPLTEPLQDQDGAAAEGKKIKKPKAKGKVHGGLRVQLVSLAAGAKELLLSRWDSNYAMVVKGEGYIDFVRRCGFKEGDAVEIWAFVQRRVRLFGKDVCGDSLLHVLVVKKDQQPAECRHCSCLGTYSCCPPVPAVNPCLLELRMMA